MPLGLNSGVIHIKTLGTIRLFYILSLRGEISGKRNICGFWNLLVSHKWFCLWICLASQVKMMQRIAACKRVINGREFLVIRFIFVSVEWLTLRRTMPCRWSRKCSSVAAMLTSLTPFAIRFSTRSRSTYVPVRLDPSLWSRRKTIRWHIDWKIII